MSDKNQLQPGKTVSTTLLVLLLLIVSALAWYTFKLQKQLEQINEQQAAIQSQLQVKLQEPPQAAFRASSATPDPASEAGAAPEPAPAPKSSDQDEVPAKPDDAVKTVSAAEQQLPEAQEAKQDSSSAQAQVPGQQQEQKEAAIPDEKAPPLHDDYYRRPFAAPRWDPYAEIERMQRDMDRAFGRQFKQLRDDPYFQHQFKQSMSTPEINVQENEHQYMVFVDLPGNDENDISVTLDGQRLTITGKQEYRQQKRDQAGNVIFQQRGSGKFQRSVTLREPVYQNEMKTRLENGVLKILIPKVDIRQRRQSP